MVELMVAVFIFSLVAAGLAQALIAAQRARHSSGLWMSATELAMERLERLRAGEHGADGDPIGVFSRSWQARSVPGYPGLERVDVTVVWEDGGRREFTLSALQRGRQ